MRVWGCLAGIGLFGHSLSLGTFQFTDLESTNQAGSRDRSSGYSPIHGFEFDFRQRMRADESGHLTMDFAYNFIAPVASISPGISVGMLDAFNETVDGKRTYVAFTFRELLQVGEKGANGDVTMGVQFGHLNSGFVGVSLPLSENFRLLTEHNGARISTGFELEAAKGIRARVVTQEGTLLFGLNLTHRF